MGNSNGRKRQSAGRGNGKFIRPELRSNRNIDIEKSVVARYAQGARTREVELCCPVNYDAKYLKLIPKEILEKDYGCGDPSRYVREGETVLDLGAGTGKICYITSQIVGPKGKVIGVDFNPAMLALARKYQKKVGEKIGWHNVRFLLGKIQDLRTDWEALERGLSRAPIDSMDEYLNFENAAQQMRARKPLIADSSIDVIISNCVLNLVRFEDKKILFQEMHRVLKKGGRVAISDIVSDEPVPQELQNDPHLWSGCISGAFQEKAFLKAFEEAGFFGIKIEKRDEKPWRTIKGLEFRSMTVTAYKGKEGPCFERNQAVIYKGPWKQVEDDDKHILRRGVPMAVCDKTFQIYSQEPYGKDVILIDPRKNVPLSKAKHFDCLRNVERDPKETKGVGYKRNTQPAEACLDGGCC